MYRPGRWVGGRFQYPRPKHPPRITRALPAGPAAVLIHGVDGSVATLCLDLDTSKALQGVVDEDAERLGRLLDSCGLRYVADVSPSGGRHLYIPLAERMDAAAARELIEALALMAPSLDASPHQNVTDGCIRVPGSAHKSGGHQILTTALSAAYDILRRRNPAAAVAALRPGAGTGTAPGPRAENPDGQGRCRRNARDRVCPPHPQAGASPRCGCWPVQDSTTRPGTPAPQRPGWPC